MNGKCHARSSESVVRLILENEVVMPLQTGVNFVNGESGCVIFDLEMLAKMCPTQAIETMSQSQRFPNGLQSKHNIQSATTCYIMLTKIRAVSDDVFQRNMIITNLFLFDVQIIPAFSLESVIKFALPTYKTFLINKFHKAE